MPQKHTLRWIDPIPLVSQAKALGQLVTGNKAGAKITTNNFITSFVSLLEPGYFRPSHPAHYSAKKKTNLTYKKWMEKLDDNMLITAVSMPGTHDSGSKVGGEFAKCQTWSIPEQLKAGIRFLDIRCRNIKNEFHIVHGIINCNLSFDEVVKYCEEFLSQNPSEFIVMRVKKESADLASTKSFDEVYREYASKDVFLKPSSKEVTVKEARGKIVVLRDFWGRGTGAEFNFYDSIIQDNYEPSSVQVKFQCVEEHYKKAEPQKTKFHINFLSACTPQHNAWPRYFARHINKKALQMFQDPERRSFGGIIAMDFPGEVLITEIIGLNLHPERKSDI